MAANMYIMKKTFSKKVFIFDFFSVEDFVYAKEV